MCRPLITEIDRYRRLLDNLATPIDLRVILIPYEGVSSNTTIYHMILIDNSSFNISPLHRFKVTYPRLVQPSKSMLCRYL